MRAVGGADLDELGAGAGHDVRHPERAADLDQFAARNDRLAAERERVEDEQNRRRVVVDDGRILGSGQLADERAQMIVTLAALALLDIEFEGNCLAHGGADGLDRLFGKKRPAEIGMQHRSGQVEDGAQGGAFPGLELRQCIGRDIARLRHGSARKPGRARIGERLANGIRGGVPSEALDRRGCERRPQHLIDRWKIAQAVAGEPVIASSIADQERVERSAPIAAFADEQIEAEGRHVVGDRIERRILVLVQDFDVAAA